MKLLLALLALLTGFAGADRAQAVPAVAAASAAVQALAQEAAQRVTAAPTHRPVATLATLVDSAACSNEPAMLGLFRPGVLTRIDRARE